MRHWRKSVAHWQVGDRHYFSVPFTWLVPRAIKDIKITLNKKNKKHIEVGGPGAILRQDMFDGLAEVVETTDIWEPVIHHNPLATFTTRGCPRQCPFCAVPRNKGDLREIKDWPVRPVVCDNNLLAASRQHFDRVIDKLKVLPFVDFNQGLDARLFSAHHARRIAELRRVKIRFAFDWIEMESTVADAISLARYHGLRDIGVYVLLGYNDTPEDALYRLEAVRKWRIRPNPQRYQPLDILQKNAYVPPNWTEDELTRMVHYYSRLRWLEHIPFEDYPGRTRARWLFWCQSKKCKTITMSSRHSMTASRR